MKNCSLNKQSGEKIIRIKEIRKKKITGRNQNHPKIKH